MTDEEQAVDISEGENEEQATEGPEASLTADGDNEFEKMAVAKVLGLKNFKEISRHDDQIGRVLDWAKSQGATSIDDIVSKIMELQNQVGHGKNIYQMSVVAGLELQKIKLEEQIKKLKYG